MKKLKQSYSSQIETYIIVTAIIATLIIGILASIAIVYRNISIETVVNVATSVTMSSAKGTANAVANHLDERIAALEGYSVLFRDCENTDNDEINTASKSFALLSLIVSLVTFSVVFTIIIKAGFDFL